MRALPCIMWVSFVFVLSGLAGCSSEKLAVTNSGEEVVKIKVDGSEIKYLAGTNGTFYFQPDSKIQIGDASIKLAQQIEIENTGSDVISVVYNDTSGSERTLMLGENGTGYLRKSIPFTIGDVRVEMQ